MVKQMGMEPACSTRPLCYSRRLWLRILANPQNSAHVDYNLTVFALNRFQPCLLAPLLVFRVSGFYTRLSLIRLSVYARYIYLLVLKSTSFQRDDRRGLLLGPYRAECSTYRTDNNFAHSLNRLIAQ